MLVKENPDRKKKKKDVNYFHEKLHHRCLAESLIHVCFHCKHEIFNHLNVLILRSDSTTRKLSLNVNRALGRQKLEYPSVRSILNLQNRYEHLLKKITINLYFI